MEIIMVKLLNLNNYYVEQNNFVVVYLFLKVSYAHQGTHI